MLRTIFWYTLLVILLICTLPLWFICVLTGGKYGPQLLQVIIDLFVPPMKAAGGLKIDVDGKENIVNGPALYVGNHQGFFDIVVILKEIGPYKPILAKEEASKIPYIAYWMRAGHCVFIKRNDARASLRALQKCEELLKNGESVVIFPEGTRSRKHEMGEFKPGALRCALKAGVPIVPFVIDGTYKGWEEHHRITPCHVHVQILEPVSTAGMEKERTKHIAEDIQEKIRETLG